MTEWMRELINKWLGQLTKRWIDERRKETGGENCWAIAYRGESKNRLKFLCLPEFQSHYFLRLLLLRVNYIQLQRKNNNLHGLTIKTKRIFGLKLGKIQSNSIMKGAGIEPATSSTEVRWLNHCDTALMNKYKLKHLTIDGSKSLLTISRLCFKMLSLSLSWISWRSAIMVTKIWSSVKGSCPSLSFLFWEVRTWYRFKCFRITISLVKASYFSELKRKNGKVFGKISVFRSRKKK